MAALRNGPRSITSLLREGWKVATEEGSRRFTHGEGAAGWARGGQAGRLGLGRRPDSERALEDTLG